MFYGYGILNNHVPTLKATAMGVITWDTDALAFISATSITDATQKSAVNTLVKDLKTASIWTKMSAIYPFVGGTAYTHKFNLKDPRDLDAAYRIVFNGGWTHSASGALSNASTAYADTKFIASTALTNNSTHFSKYNRIAESGAGLRGDGVYNFTTFPNQTLISSFYWDSGGSVNLIIGDSTASVSYSPTNGGTGFFTSTRTSANAFKLFVNNSLIGTNTTSNVATTLPNIPLYIGARNDAGSALYFNKYESAFASIGDGLSDTDASNLYTAVQKFNTTLSRNA